MATCYKSNSTFLIYVILVVRCSGRSRLFNPESFFLHFLKNQSGKEWKFKRIVCFHVHDMGSPMSSAKCCLHQSFAWWNRWFFMARGLL